jgi:hypothetical protein
MIDVNWLRNQSEAAQSRTVAMSTSMRAAQHRLLARSTRTDRAVELTTVRRARGPVPRIDRDNRPHWSAFIARGPGA